MLKKMHIFRYGLMALSCLTMLVLAGCNTVHGAGEDIEHAGESVQDAAD